MSYRNAAYDQTTTLPDGRPITLRWELTLEKGEPSQGSWWGVADASLEGFALKSGHYFKLGEQATREMLEGHAGAEWLTEREGEILEMDGLDLEKLVGRD